MIGQQMREYLANYKELQRLGTEIGSLLSQQKRLTERQNVLRPVLEKSVQPICGSAHLPDIRTLTDGQYTTITVYYCHSFQRGHIRITSNEKEAVE